MTSKPESRTADSASRNIAAKSFGSRMWMAMSHACLKPAALHERLQRDYNISVGRTSIYAALKGEVSRPRYVNELAEICKVNLQWLISGKGHMVDLNGQSTVKENAQQQVMGILRTHIIPPKRADLVRLSDRILEALSRGSISQEDSAVLLELLDALEIVSERKMKEGDGGL